MSIRVLFFASLAETTGISEAELPANEFATVGAILEHYAGRFTALGAGRPSILCALNSAYAKPEAPVRDGDEVAFFPPVSGG